MPPFNWGPLADVVANHHRFDPPMGTISLSTLLALLSDGKYIRDHFSDLYIGMVVFAVRAKFKGWLKFHGCLLTLPLNEDLKLRPNSFVVQFGQPFLLPDGLVWKINGYEFRGSNTDLAVSPLKFDDIAPDDAADSVPEEYNYAIQNLVQPRVNFNNVVSYHDSHPDDSCTDGLCEQPKKGDAVHSGFEANDRPGSLRGTDRSGN